jgi:hypothetical protein
MSNMLCNAFVKSAKQKEVCRKRNISQHYFNTAYHVSKIFTNNDPTCAYRPIKSIRDLHPGGWDS